MSDDVYYSEYEDDWSHPHQAPEIAARAYFDSASDADRQEAKVITIFKGVKKIPDFDRYLCVNHLLNSMSNRAYGDVGDLACDYLLDVSDTKVEELKSLIETWASRNDIKPSWYVIEDIEEIEFIVPNDWIYN